MKFFFTTKLHWGSVILFPYSSFVWRGSDGTEVVAHLSQGIGYNNPVLVSDIRKAATEYRQADVHDEFLMPCGFGDGGGGVSAEMCERARRLGSLAGTPSSTWGRIDEFFGGLEQLKEKLPIYCGELYLQYHRGVLTTQSDLKLAFRLAERSLQECEASRCATGGGPIETELWRRIVFAQFHDYVPGSSIKEVYAEALPELRGIQAKARQETLQTLSNGCGGEALFNPLPMRLRGFHDGRLVELPPLAGVLTKDLVAIKVAPAKANALELRNGRVRARFDRLGQVKSLEVDGHQIAQSGSLGQLVVFPDRPHAYEAWDIDRSTLSLGRKVPGARFVEALEEDGCAKTIFENDLGNGSTGRTIYKLRAGSSVLEIEYRIAWKSPEFLLKVLFPTLYRGSKARFGDPFGSVLRSQTPGKVYDEAQWEICGNRYAIVSDDGEADGLFVVTEAKFGWTCRDGILGLSLLRSARMTTPNRDTVEDRPASSEDFSDLGEHSIRIAVGRFHNQLPMEELPAALADTCFVTPLNYSGPAYCCGFRGLEGEEFLVPLWARPELNGAWTLRLHETLGRRGCTLIQLEPGWQMRQTNLSGILLPHQTKGNTIQFEPYQIITLRIEKIMA